MLFRLKKHPVTLYPRHWPSNIAEGSKIGVSNAVFDELKASFEKSIRKPVRIINIEEICNHKYLDRFERYMWIFLILFSYFAFSNLLKLKQ